MIAVFGENEYLEGMNGGTTEAEPRHMAVSRAASSHFGLIVTLVAFLIVAVKSLSVARFAPATALSLLEHAGPISVFLGALLVGFPIFLMITAILIFVMERMLDMTLRSLYVPLVGIGFIAIPWIDFLALGGLVAALFLAAVERDPANQPSGWRKSMDAWFTRKNRGNYLLVGLTTLLVLVFFTSGQPWVPLEKLEVDGREITGYVISDDSEWTHLLLAQTRQVHRIRSNEIGHRVVCSQREFEQDLRPSIAGTWGAARRPVIQLLTNERVDAPSYPACTP